MSSDKPRQVLKRLAELEMSENIIPLNVLLRDVGRDLPLVVGDLTLVAPDFEILKINSALMDFNWDTEECEAPYCAFYNFQELLLEDYGTKWGISTLHNLKPQYELEDIDNMLEESGYEGGVADERENNLVQWYQDKFDAQSKKKTKERFVKELSSYLENRKDKKVRK